MHDYSGIAGYAEACRIQRAHTTARSRCLQRFEDYSKGAQYRHLADWWSDKPIWKRAPCIVDPVVMTAIRSNVDLVLGEGRWPAITSRVDENNDDEGLGEDNSEQLDDFLEKLQHSAKFSAHCRQALQQAQAVGTAVGLFGLRNQRPFAELVRAQWCARDLDDEGKVSKLVIQYPYLSVEDEGRKQVVRCRLYRRDIDAHRDVTYKPVVLTRDGVQSQMAEDPRHTIDHGLGFCPAVWYPFMRECSVVNEIDGRPVHEDLTDEIDGLNYALSQKHMAAIYSGQPQPYEIGVEPGYNPSDGTRSLDSHPASAHGETGKQTSGYSEHSGYREGRIKGPGNVWQYPAGVTVGNLTIPEGSLGAIDNHCRDIRSKITEGLAVVNLDPDQVKFAATVSGKALETLRARQLDRCDQIRDDFRDGYLLPAIDILIRIVYTAKSRNEEIDIPGIDQALVVLDQVMAA